MLYKKLAKHKSSGRDGLPAEAFQCLKPNLISNLLAKLFNQINHENKLPSYMQETNTTLIYKKNDKTDINNYRGITIENTIQNIFSQVIYIRLKRIIRKVVPQNQAGFIPHRHMSNQINSLRHMMTRARCMHKPLNVLFIDFVKAFDRIDYNFIAMIMEKVKIPTNIINSAKMICSQLQTCIMTNKTISEPISPASGIRQGDPMSGFLFAISTLPLILSLNAHTVSPNSTNNLWYADDLTLITPNMSDMNTLLDSVHQWSEISNMEFNPSKSTLIQINPPHRSNSFSYHNTEFPIADPTIPVRYLGVGITRLQQLHIFMPCKS